MYLRLLILCVGCSLLLTFQPLLAQNEDNRAYAQGMEWETQEKWDSAAHYFYLAARQCDTLPGWGNQPSDWEFQIRALSKASEMYENALQLPLSNEVAGEAIRLGEAHLKKNHPLMFQAWFVWGNSFFRQSQFEAAEIAFRKGIEAYPQSIQDSTSTYYAAWAYKVLGESFLIRQNMDSSLRVLERGEVIAQKLAPHRKQVLTVMLNIQAYIYMLKGEFDQSLNKLDASLHIAREMEDLVEQARALNGKGNIYERQGKLEEAEAAFREELALKQGLLSPDDPNLGLSYLNIGTTAQSRKDYYTAMTYYRQALQSISDDLNYSHILMINMGICANLIEEPASALSYLRVGMRRMKIRLKKNIRDYENAVMLARYLSELGWTFHLLGQTDSAGYYLRQSLDADTKMARTDPFTLFAIYERMGRFESSHQRYAQAIDSYQRGIDLLLPLSDVQARYGQLGQMYARVSEAYAAMGQCENALQAYQQAIEALFPLGIPTADSPDRLPRERVHFYPTIEALIRSRDLCGADKTPINGLLQAVIQTSDAYDQDLREDASTALDLKELRNVLSYAIGANWEAAPARAFYFAEKGKTRLLRQGLKSAQARQFAYLPEAVREREQSILEEMARALKAERAAETAGDSVALVQEQDQFFQARASQDSLVQVLRQTYPDYFRLKYDSHVAEIDQIQASLPDSTAILEYHVGPAATFLFLISNREFQAWKLDPVQPGHIDSLRRGLTGFYTEPDAGRQAEAGYDLLYRTYAHQLYQQLLAPVADRLPIRLVIIPDAQLAYVPFEVLLTEAMPVAGLPSQYPYLIRQKTISYAHSASLWLDQQASAASQGADRDLLALAPEFDPQDVELSATENLAVVRGEDLMPLLYSGEEITHISRIWGGETHAGEEASLSRFLADAHRYQVLHIASHAEVNEQQPRFSYIAFSPDSSGPSLMYLADIYNLRLNAELAVLSACNTASGKLSPGEGLSSLASGFFYAGARSLVTTLWSVDDRYTSELMVAFYAQLKTGITKDEALRAAKLQILTDHNLPPYYWAAPIAIGDMRPLEKQSSWPWFWLWIVSGSVLAAGTIIWQYQKS